MEYFVQSQVMYLASLIGGIAFGLSGYLVGAGKNLDWMGLLILTFLTANGGGILRDVLADRTPVILLSNEPFLLALAVMFLGSVLKLGRVSVDGRPSVEDRWFFVVSDAVGLVAFAVTGALVGLELQAPFFGFLTLAFLTAVGGSILRDILVNNVPEVLHSGFYGSIAVLVALGVYFLNLHGMLTSLNLLGLSGAGLAIRLVAYRRRWRLPRT